MAEESNATPRSPVPDDTLSSRPRDATVTYAHAHDPTQHSPSLGLASRQNFGRLSTPCPMKALCTLPGTEHLTTDGQEPSRSLAFAARTRGRTGRVKGVKGSVTDGKREQRGNNATGEK